MGPELYDSLDSLKAQAVAARTFTVRSLGGFVDEGFDLCASPRCQAYGGMNAEHPLSDRAVAETGGEIVLYHGEIAEALYSASCGGNTENVEVVFPQRRGEHLRAVPCPERGVVRIAAGTPAIGASYVHRILELLDEQRSRSAARAARRGRSAVHQARIEALVERAGLAIPAERSARSNGPRCAGTCSRRSISRSTPPCCAMRRPTPRPKPPGAPRSAGSTPVSPPTPSPRARP